MSGRGAIAALGWSLVGVGGQALIQFLTVAWISRLLTPAAVGLAALGLSVLGIGQILAQLGIAPALVQRRALHTKHLHAGFALSLVLGAALAVASVVLAPGIASVLRAPDLAPVLVSLSFFFPLRSLGIVPEAILQRELRFREISAIDIASYSLGYSAVGLLLAVRGYGVYAIVGAQLGQTLLRSVLLLLAAPQAIGITVRREARLRILAYGTGLTTAQLAHAVALNADNFVVGRILGEAALGAYSRAYQLLIMPASLLGNVLDRVLFPVLAQSRHDEQRLCAAITRTLHLIALVALPGTAAMATLAPEIVLVVLGPQWTEVVAPLQVLALGLLFRSSFQIGDALARAVGAVWQSSQRQLLYAAAVIVGSIVGSSWGLVGVAAGVLLALVIKFVAMAQLTVRLTALSWQALVRAHAGGAVLGIVSLVVTFGCATLLRAVGAGPVAVLALATLAMAGACALTTVAAPRLVLAESRGLVVQRLASLTPRLAARLQS